MNPVVIKRDGCRVSFDILRIKEAVLGASIDAKENIIDESIGIMMDYILYDAIIAKKIGQKKCNYFYAISCYVLFFTTIFKLLISLYVRNRSYNILLTIGFIKNQCIGRIKNRSPPLSAK